MIKTILFDLDGTLLPMDQDVFVKSYFGRLAKKAAPYGYETGRLVSVIWKGTEAMVKNDGSALNEEVFWEVFAENYGSEALKDKAVFDEFYEKEFQEVASDCGCNPKAKQTVSLIKEKGYRTVLATNPIFPAVATESRMRWAGFQPEDFEYYTTYENSCHSKPNPAYYRDILDRIGCEPLECLMVGNDVTEDMAAESLGMKVFLLTDCLINSGDADISVYPNGSFDDLMDYIKTLEA